MPCMTLSPGSEGYRRDVLITDLATGAYTHGGGCAQSAYLRSPRCLYGVSTVTLVMVSPVSRPRLSNLKYTLQKLGSTYYLGASSQT